MISHKMRRFGCVLAVYLQKHSVLTPQKCKVWNTAFLVFTAPGACEDHFLSENKDGDGVFIALLLSWQTYYSVLREVV